MKYGTTAGPDLRGRWPAHAGRPHPSRPPRLDSFITTDLLCMIILHRRRIQPAVGFDAPAARTRYVDNRGLAPPIQQGLHIHTPLTSVLADLDFGYDSGFVFWVTDFGL